MVSENKNIEKENIEDLYHNLKIGLEDVVNGNTRPFSEFISEIKNKRQEKNKQTNRRLGNCIQVQQWQITWYNFRDKGDDDCTLQNIIYINLFDD